MLKSYKEGRQYLKPIKGKDGYFYNLFFYKGQSEPWAVSKFQKQKLKTDFVEGCQLEKYREAWLLFLECLAGKKPDFDTWQPPKKK